jgi:hypothetical protein
MKGFWYPISKGGSFKKWFGNNEHIINLRNNAYDIKNGDSNFRLREDKWYFKPYVTWSRISSSSIAFRISYGGVLFADAAPGIFAYNDCEKILSLLNSKLSNYILSALNPTMNYQTNDIERIPSISISNKKTGFMIKLSKSDWDSYETSWDFQSPPLLQPDYLTSFLSTTYQSLRTHWQFMTDEMLKLEEENNRIFIEAYGLEDELTPDVPIEEITLTCNPYYRYGNNKSEAELEVLLLADTMREFISYAVGCMFGRYSLDKPGLVLANQGDTLQEYLAQVPAPTFMPDADNVIPILDGDWFADDIVERFKEFLRITFGKEHYEENLAFIESAIGKDIRKFFLKDFYTDHVKRYKKRPIYWLFTSPRGTFNALIYMHRYRPDTVSVVLNKYLREFKVKLHARLDQLRRIEVGSDASKADKARAIKAIDTLRKDLDELDQWERDVIFPLAVKQIEIDLDDGVKVNYPKFGTALKKIPGLEANED